MKELGKLNPMIAIVAVVAVVAALVVTFSPSSPEKYVVAEFPRTVSLYEGSDVKILGVAVGKVDSVTPSGTNVRVKFHYDAQHKVPADAKAVIISPSIVGDRFVQLTPAYTGGDVLPDNARLGVDRTADTARARRDLRRAQRPQHRPRSGRCQQARRERRGAADPAPGLHRPQLRWPGRGVQRDLEELRRLLQDPRRQRGQFGTLAQVEDFTRRWPTTTRRCAGSTDRWPSGAGVLADERRGAGSGAEEPGASR